MAFMVGSGWGVNLRRGGNIRCGSVGIAVEDGFGGGDGRRALREGEGVGGWDLVSTATGGFPRAQCDASAVCGLSLSRLFGFLCDPSQCAWLEWRLGMVAQPQA